MTKKQAGKDRRKVGQPLRYAGERTTVLAVTVPESLVAELDAAVEDRRRSAAAGVRKPSRSSLLVELVRAGLRAS